MTRVERLFSRLVIDPNTGCVNWTGWCGPNGYGLVSWKGRTRLVHRVVWELTEGPIPAGLTLDHLCRNRACASVAHLEPVTNRENLMRGAGITAAHAAKTHCHNGHPFSEANTYWRLGGGRACRACHREHKPDKAKRAAYMRAWRAQRGGAES